MLNQIILIGRTVRDVEIKTATNGRPFAIMTVAVQRSFRNQQTNAYDTDFIDVSLWGNLAENVAKYAGKGSAISIRGRIANRVTDIPGHPTVHSAGVIGEQVSFIQTKRPGMTIPNGNASDGNDGNNADEEHLINSEIFDSLPSNEQFEAEIQIGESEDVPVEQVAS